MVRLVPVKEEDYRELQLYARPEEVNEVWASHLMTVEEAAKMSVENSKEAYSAFFGNTLLCMTGICPLNSFEAIPWLLTTRDMPKHPRKLLRYTKLLLKRWSEEWDVLANWVDARYEQSLRWAKHTGFRVSEVPEAFGPLNLPFYKIEYRS